MEGTSNLLEYIHDPSSMNGKPLSFIIASGPYTLDSNLFFEPFRELMRCCQEEKPDVLLLVMYLFKKSWKFKEGGVLYLTESYNFTCLIRLAHLWMLNIL